MLARSLSEVCYLLGTECASECEPAPSSRPRVRDRHFGPARTITLVPICDPNQLGHGMRRPSIPDERGGGEARRLAQLSSRTTAIGGSPNLLRTSEKLSTFRLLFFRATVRRSLFARDVVLLSSRPPPFVNVAEPDNYAFATGGPQEP